MPAAFHLDQSCLVAVIEVVELGHPAEHGFLLGFGQRGPVICVVGHEEGIGCRKRRGNCGADSGAVGDVELGSEHLSHELVDAVGAHVAEDGDSLFRGIHHVVAQGDGQERRDQIRLVAVSEAGMVLPEADGEGVAGNLQTVHGDLGVIPLPCLINGRNINMLISTRFPAQESLLIGDRATFAEGPGHAIGVGDMDSVVDLGWGGGHSEVRFFFRTFGRAQAAGMVQDGDNGVDA